MKLMKVPVKDVLKEPSVEKVEAFLRRNRDYAYTVNGIMIELFNIEEEKLENLSFRHQEKGLPKLYSQITRFLQKLSKENKINSTKDGRAWVYYWRVEDG